MSFLTASETHHHPGAALRLVASVSGYPRARYFHLVYVNTFLFNRPFFFTCLAGRRSHMSRITISVRSAMMPAVRHVGRNRFRRRSLEVQPIKDAKTAVPLITHQPRLSLPWPCVARRKSVSSITMQPEQAHGSDRAPLIVYHSSPTRSLCLRCKTDGFGQVGGS